MLHSTRGVRGHAPPGKFLGEGSELVAFGVYLVGVLTELISQFDNQNQCKQMIQAQ